MTVVWGGINYGASWYVSGGIVTGFDKYTDLIIIFLDKGIYIGFSYRYFKGFNNDDIEGLVAGLWYFINDGVSCCVYGWLGTGLNRYSY